jgi:hypothetical protein
VTVITDIPAVLGIFAAIVTEVIEIAFSPVAIKLMAIVAEVPMVLPKLLAIVTDIPAIIISALGLAGDTCKQTNGKEYN